ncbi:MAG: YHS domain-containing protein [Planctomycetota bacterium]|jgi:YHS domain-containing protein
MKRRTIVLVSVAAALVLLLFGIYAVAQETATTQNRCKTAKAQRKAATPMMGCCPGCPMGKAQAPVGTNASGGPQKMMQRCANLVMEKAGITPAMMQRCQVMMHKPIFMDSPCAIYGQADALKLSEEQKKKLLEIENEARKKALAVLTSEQREKMGEVPDKPMAMAQMCRQMCSKMMPMMQKMMGSQSKDGPMMCPLMQIAAEGERKQGTKIEQTVCPVVGGAINKDVFAVYKGKKVYFCCAGCIGGFKANPEKYLNKLPQFKEAKPAKKAKVVSVGTEQKVCPIMGGSINKAVFTVYKGKKVYFCCPGCKPEFEKNPETFMTKLPQFKK